MGTSLSTPKIAVVILNWNGKEDTLECLESVFKSNYPNLYVVVVDNGSRDDSVPAIRRAFPATRLLEAGENLGYAGGNNVGIGHALEEGSDYIFILNNDTLVPPDTISKLVTAAGEKPQAGVFGPVIYDATKPNRIVTAGERLTSDRNLAIENIAHGEVEPPIQDQCYPVDWVTGAAFFLRRSAIEQIGLFDERFFLVYEESDWCFRAKRKGLLAMVVPNASVLHKVSASFDGEDSPLRVYFNRRNRLLFAEKHLGVAVLLKLGFQGLRDCFPRFSSPAQGDRFSIRSWYWAFRDSIRTWRSPTSIVTRRGVIDYLLRRLGDCPESIRALANSRSESPHRTQADSSVSSN